jgi:hypothetical protein
VNVNLAHSFNSLVKKKKCGVVSKFQFDGWLDIIGRFALASMKEAVVAMYFDAMDNFRRR